MRFGVLGPLEVWTDAGGPVRVPELKVRALLADLLVNAGRPVSADRLVDDLWPRDPPGKPLGALRAKVSQLRRVLREAEPGGAELVLSRPPGYLLHGADVDARRFEELTGRARAAAGPAARAALLTEALLLWRGPAFADFADDAFTRSTIARLDEARLTAQEDLAEARLALGEHSALVGELHDHVDRHPLRERFGAALMLALYRSGRQNEALDVHRALRTRLDGELGLAPGPEIDALHQAILEQSPSLDAPAPAARAGALAARPLPVPYTELVGRTPLVDEVRVLVGKERLVTLTGPGGVGKTRLALEAAASEPFPDGVHLVELAALPPGSPDGKVAEAVADALGHDGPEPAAALAGTHALLLLDNCEHVAEPVAALADRLLRAVPGLRILATSREPVGIAGEIVRPVPPLDEDAAARLFASRAAAAAGLTLGPGEAGAVATICRRLDGLPLALELAAARVNGLGVHELAARLDDRFGLLGAGRRGAVPGRQRTLRATIEWSWDLLAEPERVLLRRLAVHPGGFTLETAEETGGVAGAPAVLAGLVDRSLAVRAETGRYRLLESIAAYGAERLREAGELDAVQRRRDLYYTMLAECAEVYRHGPARLRWIARLDAETANLRAALRSTLDRRDTELAVRLTGALAWYWMQNGRPGEASRSLGDVLAYAAETLRAEASGERGPRRAAFALEGLAAAYLLTGRAGEAARLLGAAAALRLPATPARPSGARHDGAPDREPAPGGAPDRDGLDGNGQEREPGPDRGVGVDLGGGPGMEPDCEPGCDPVDGPARTDLEENTRITAAVRAALGDAVYEAEFAEGLGGAGLALAAR
ncbi:BTAD domain-containing putative transcriptional regulator [Spirillospora sp. NPDC047279]|uniref:AfsR/SARP family transcriptional regulator n=1 Tax=Spirillospora sp. NPDC047279 TaxID=3155478 RepID=UPI0033C9C930